MLISDICESVAFQTMGEVILLCVTVVNIIGRRDMNISFVDCAVELPH